MRGEITYFLASILLVFLLTLTGCFGSDDNSGDSYSNKTKWSQNRGHGGNDGGHCPNPKSVPEPGIMALIGSLAVGGIIARKIIKK